MTHNDFSQLVLQRCETIQRVLVAKGEGYSTEADRLANFKRIGHIIRCTPERALLGLWIKSLVAIFDAIDLIDANDLSSVKVQGYDERITDAINYLILLEGLLKERLNARA